jgi:TolB protein
MKLSRAQTENPRSFVKNARRTRHTRVSFLRLALIFLASALRAQQPVGIFDNHADVGAVLHPGSTTFAAPNTYILTGSGDNMWLANDAFQFAWKKMSGDVEITADVKFETLTGNEHKKAVLIFRQSLESDSVYVDVALHASGLTSLQYRDKKGAMTHEVQSNINNYLRGVTKGGTAEIPFEFTSARLQLTRRGNYVYLSQAPGGPGQALHYDGESIRVPLEGMFYVGIGVCSHDKQVVEQARFSNVELKVPGFPAEKPALFSTLETVEVESTDRRVVYFAPGRFEAPNWSRDGSYFLFNRDGHIEKLQVAGGKPEIINTGLADRVNNDHGISPDATQLAVSDNSQEKQDSLVYVVPIAGGAARRITQNSPSYWHGWSPDGKTLAFVGQRNGEFDIYTIPVTGGNETRLTTAKGLDDGPEYSPDGQHIYFNSERTGHMQIWRMRADGSDQEQVFADDYNNWFPHISPDGKWMVFLTYEKDVTGHPENKDVMLRLMSLSSEPTNDRKITVLAKLFGGQGTINVPSWSPDSKSVAFVSYQFIAP